MRCKPAFPLSRLLACLVALGVTVPGITHASEPGEAIHPAAPWATYPADGEPRSIYERITGIHIDPADYPAPVEAENMVFDAEGFGVDTLKALDLPPLPALDFDPTPGVLYLELKGVTLKPTCPKAQTANGALNCSPLVSKETVFPAYGSGQQQAALVQKLANYYAPFNIVISTNRPPDYLPYTMAVVGGTSGNAGKGNGVCGIANVACDGAKRNHVSLTFPSSCNAVAEIAAQETAHNWGLEHTDITSDIMYPFVQGGSQSFRNECMDISHATGDGITQCTYVHENYCPGGGGEEQNSYAELLGVFGPRAEDTEAPQILEISPADGSVFTTSESFVVSAKLADNFNMLGVKWTWIEGIPEEVGTSYTKCTNKVCDDEFIAWKDISTPWDFLSLTKPPLGNYSFKLEVMDAYGNYTTKTVSVSVVEDDGGTSGGSTGGTSGGTSDGTGGETESGTGGTGGETGGSDGTGGETSGGSAGVTSAGTSGVTGNSTFGGDDATATATGGGDEDGGCRIGARAPSALLGIVVVAAFGRRRRRA